VDRVVRLRDKLVKQRLRFLQITRVEPLSEPAVNRSKQFVGLLRFALVAPQPRHAHRRTQFPRGAHAPTSCCRLCLWPPPRTGGDVTKAVFDHEAVFRRRGSRGPRGWQDCAIVSQPYGHVFRDGVFHSEFIAGAQALLQRGVETWVHPDLSFWFPGATVLVVLARDVVPERASELGFTQCSQRESEHACTGT
jgi:hypothetical protein